MRDSAAIITFSHLRWNFVHQRPQHLLSRLAQNRKVFFIEEPVLDSAEPAWEISHPAQNVTVLRPHTPVARNGFHDEQIPVLRSMLARFLETGEADDHVAWFYTPMALPLVDMLRPRAVIYDCMDELSGFLNAPPQLMERERQLFAMSDLVFTGGRSLYAAKKTMHANVHCFPSSVDADHFSRGVVEHEEAGDQRDLNGPKLGYYGVIDERIDLDILDAMAKAHPEWRIVMVGPVVKIDPAALPRHGNISYLGQRDYAQLPSYLRGWDVTLLPFARNDATRFISPTKTLEYMAARKLIVSTPIQDVVEPFGRFVFLGDSPAAFVKACEDALQCGDAERRARLDDGSRVIARTSWARTVESMEKLIEDAIRGRRSATVDLSSSTSSQIPASAPVVVAGAGPTGLSAAYHLGENSMLIEANSEVGGWCRSIEEGGFTFDYAGHIMFSADPYVHQMYNLLLGDNVHWQDREAWVYSKNVFTRYPFQGSLYGLPADVVKECIVGAIEARFGPSKQARPQQHAAGGNGSAANGSPANGRANGAMKGNLRENGSAAHSKECARDGVADCCGDGILESSAPLGKERPAAGEKAEPRNFEEFIYKVWGAGIAKHFAIPYNRKLWAVPLSEMETSWLGGRVPMPDLEEMIDGALKPTPKPMGPNARFGYPLRGGFQALMNGFLPHLKGELRLNTRVERVFPFRHSVTLSDGQEVCYRHLISTMPLPALIRAMGNSAPAEIREAADMLRHVSVRCVHLGIGRENVTEKHWIYYPEDTVFHRIFVQGNASPHCNPAGGFGLTCEITYSEHKPLPADGRALIDRCIADCRKVGIIREDDPVWVATQVDLPYAYVVYDHHRKQAVELIREWLAKHDIILAGRYSEWEYYNSDHAFIAGRKAAETALEMDRKLQQESTLLQAVPLSSAVLDKG